MKMVLSVGLCMVLGASVNALDLHRVSEPVLKDAKEIAMASRGRIHIESKAPTSGYTTTGYYQLDAFTPESQDIILRKIGMTREDVQRREDEARAAAAVSKRYQLKRKVDRSSLKYQKAVVASGRQYRIAFTKWHQALGKSTSVRAYLDSRTYRAQLRTECTSALDALSTAVAEWKLVEEQNPDLLTAARKEQLTNAQEGLALARKEQVDISNTEAALDADVERRIAAIAERLADHRTELREAEKLRLMRRQTWAAEQQVEQQRQIANGVEGINTWLRYGW